MYILRRGANPNALTASGHTPLHFATAADHTESIAMLLATGSHEFAADVDGDTPLKLAAVSPNLVLNVFLEFRPWTDLNYADDDGDTLLHLASRSGNSNFDWLIRNGADCNAINAAGDSPLHNVAKLGTTLNTHSHLFHFQIRFDSEQILLETSSAGVQEAGCAFNVEQTVRNR